MSHETEHEHDISEPGDPAGDTSTASECDGCGKQLEAQRSEDATAAYCAECMPPAVPTGASADAPAEAEDVLREAGEEAGSDPEPVQSTGVLKSGVSASEAASLRWAKHRARQAAQDALPELDDAADLIVRVPIARRAILTELEKKAKAGDTGASRELRAWIMELPIEDETDVSTLDRRTRQSLMAELLGVVRDQSADGLSHPPIATT